MSTLALVPSKIIGFGANYRSLVIKTNQAMPDEPRFFLKPPSALVGHDEPIVRPRGFARVDFEGELGVVIGRRCKDVRADEALAQVAGYTVVNDVTVVDLARQMGKFMMAKSFDTFCAVGPRVVPGLDPRALGLRARLNGVLKQETSTSDLVFSVPQLIEFVSRGMTLEPGDLLLTGTPWGCGNLAPGDVIEVEIDGIGTLRNTVVEEAPARREEP